MPLEVLDLRNNQAIRAALTSHVQGWDAPALSEAASTVRRIIGDIRTDGDKALLAYTQKFDGSTLMRTGLEMELVEEAAARVSDELTDALRFAADNIRVYHESAMPSDWEVDRHGAKMGQRHRPIRRIGVYAPGGRATYPSTVLMCAIPAKVAGVSEVVLCTPPNASGMPSDVVCAAALIAGVTEVWLAGGAQAVAAMAYGTESLDAVDKICGPGNVYVTLAKREVFGAVGIDGLFGPSEAVVVADAEANPAFAAAELLTQAEHDPEASAILVTDSPEQLSAVLTAINEQLPDLPRSGLIRDALASHGLGVVVRDLEQAAEVVDILGPEHLCVHVDDPESFVQQISYAGTVLLGAGTPATLTDYVAGPSHVLPTARTARFSSGLGVSDFLVSMNCVSYTPDAVQRDSAAALALADAEGLKAHRTNLELRLQ